MKSKILYIALLALLACSLAVAQEGAVTVPRNLAELTAQAQTIVRGTIISAVVEPHPTLTNLKTVLVTMHVDKALKGRADKTLTYRSFIWDYRDKLTAGGYRKGEQVILLLNPTTTLGLTSTVGLGQGRFHIMRANGVEYAVNDRRNTNLMRGLPETLSAKGIKLNAELSAAVSKPAAGPIRADQLESLITTIGQGK
jgi:hypothetical protein